MHIGPLDIYYIYVISLIHKQQVSIIFTHYTYMILQTTLEHTGNVAEKEAVVNDVMALG